MNDLTMTHGVPSSPSPSKGEGWGEGEDTSSHLPSHPSDDATRHPSPSPNLSPTWGRGIRVVARALAKLLIGLVWLYRITLGPVLGGQCRFHPTCSQYMIDAINKHGPVRGGWRGIKRIARCHPWSKGGIDEA